MLRFPAIDPVIVSLGPLEIRWYGMMYLLGFLAAYLLGRRRARSAWSPMRENQVEDFIFLVRWGRYWAVALGTCCSMALIASSVTQCG